MYGVLISEVHFFAITGKMVHEYGLPRGQEESVFAPSAHCTHVAKVWCAHGAKMDSFDPVEVCIHGPFSLCIFH